MGNSFKVDSRQCFNWDYGSALGYSVPLLVPLCLGCFYVDKIVSALAVKGMEGTCGLYLTVHGVARVR